MRYFGLIVIVGLVLFLGWFLFYKELSNESKPAVTNPGTPKAIGTGASAVRALDQVLTDPTLIGSSEWRKNAEKTVNDWYGQK